MTTIGGDVAAALSGRYTIERELGAGGMATVYLARDVKHDRKVAVKVLHPDLAAALGAERFLAEIRTTANLQHPHILALHDSGEADGFLFYVMPFIDGESLRDRLTRERQLPIGDALRIAREVADALGYAHEHRVIHRDIKPENILLQGGHALVADFGIALAVQSAGGQRMTQTGLSLGTPQYMSPEQAMGERTIDARSDIYALGAVVYEMLAGDAPFTGSSVQAVVAKILSEKPTPLHTLRDTVPSGVEHAVLTALAKLPADRFANAAGFAAALASTGDAPAIMIGRGGATSRASAGSRRTLVALCALALVACVAAAWGWLRAAPANPTSRQQVVLWKYAVPDPFKPGASFVATQAALAPDGSAIVYADSVSGWILMRKRRDAAVAEPIAGSEGGVSPFYSPDGKWIGFLTLDGKLKKVPAAGGSPITIAEGAPTDYFSAAWLDDGSIVYGKNDLFRISSTGNAKPVALNMKRASGGWMQISPLPGGRGFLTTFCAGNCAFSSDVYVYDFAADSARVLVPHAVGAWYSPTGHLLYTMREGGLFAAAFDRKRLAIRSDPVPVLDGVRAASLAFSPSGTTVYMVDATANAPSTLVWVDRQGREEPFDSSWAGRFEYPALSPDGKSLAVSDRGRTTDLWIRRADGTRRKVSAPGVANWRSSWFPDGKSLLFLSVRSGDSADVYRVNADASASAELVFRHRFGVYEAVVGTDSQWMVFRAEEGAAGGNIYARRIHGDTTLTALVATPANEMNIGVSPNGKWLAYTTDASGTREVYVASLPDMRTNRLVSRGGGTEPRWAHSGRELFFESGGRLVVVAVGAGADLDASEPRPLFSVAGYRRARNRPQYDVAPEDQRFLMIKDPPAPAVPPVIYVENWFKELLAKVK